MHLSFVSCYSLTFQNGKMTSYHIMKIYPEIVFCLFYISIRNVDGMKFYDPKISDWIRVNIPDFNVTFLKIMSIIQ